MSFVRGLFLAFFSLTAAAAPLPEIHLQPKTAVLRFAVAGDTGEGAEAVAKGIANVHKAQALDAIVLVGDTFYPCGVTSPKDPRWNLVAPLTKIGVPVFPVLGNHDFCGKSDPDAQIGAPLEHWMFPARQYAVRTPFADFVFLDTTPYVRKRGRAPEVAVAEGFATSKVRWRIVVGHHPVISSGYHGYFPRDEVNRMREIIPTLRAAKADLYICGHDHHLEYLRGRMRHLVSGAGSEPIPPIKLHLTTVFPAEIRREHVGFAVVEISAKKLRVRFYDADGKPKSEWL